MVAGKLLILILIIKTPAASNINQYFTIDSTSTDLGFMFFTIPTENLDKSSLKTLMNKNRFSNANLTFCSYNQKIVANTIPNYKLIQYSR